MSALCGTTIADGIVCQPCVAQPARKSTVHAEVKDDAVLWTVNRQHS